MLLLAAGNGSLRAARVASLARVRGEKMRARQGLLHDFRLLQVVWGLSDCS